MGKKERIFKTFILFLLFGCSQKYVDDRGRSLEDKIIASWEELDCSIVARDEQGFSLVVKVKDFIVVGDSVGAGEFYKRRPLNERGAWAFLGSFIGIAGCLGGIGYGLSDFSLDGYNEEKYDRACLISFASCLAGAGVAFVGLPNRKKLAKAIPHTAPYFVKGDTVCADSVFLAKEEIKIIVEKTDFEKTYYTDENGNVKLSFEEIIPEPANADSVLSLIIQYYKLVDTVEVRCL